MEAGAIFTGSTPMRNRKGHPMHSVAPKEWRHTADRTGSYELDAVIGRNPNKDMARRLDMYLDQADNAYGPKTGYSGYHGYSGDD